MKDPLIIRKEVDSTLFSLLKDMKVERGTKDDWEQLHALHYKSSGKATGRVYRVILNEKQLIAVMIVGSPRLLLRARHEVFPKIKPGNDTKLTNVWRAKYINQHFGLCSRIVVDTLFRASGVSYRLLNLAARMEGKRYMEIQSSMSRFNPFAIRAGFKFTKPKEAHAYEKGLALMLRIFECHPADHASVMLELASMSEGVRNRTLKKLKEFYYKNSALEKTGPNLNAGTSKVDAMEPTELIRQLQQLVFASPMYGIFKNPDEGIQLPSSLPLLAFDEQETNEPLRMLK